MNDVLMSLLGLALVALTGLTLWMSEREREWRLTERAEHAKCMAMVSSVLSTKFTAQTVRDLAVRFDSVENQLELGRIRNGYTGDSQSVVALWLDEQAARIEADE